MMCDRLMIVYMIRNDYFSYYFFFFFNDTATTEIYTLSLHDALPISSMIVLPSWTPIELRMRRCRIVGESMFEVVVRTTSLTDCAISSVMKPLALTRGCTSTMTPVSR